MSTKVRP